MALEVLRNGKLVGDSTDETYHALMEQAIEFCELVSQYDTAALEQFCRKLADTLSEYNKIIYEKRKNAV